MNRNRRLLAKKSLHYIAVVDFDLIEEDGDDEDED
jgi:hypothetical protein